MAKGLAQLGVEVQVVTTDANLDTKLNENLTKLTKLESNLYVKYYKSITKHGMSISHILALPKYIKECDVVYLQGVFNIHSPITLFLSKVYKKKIIFSTRGALGGWCLDQGSKFKKPWLHYLIKPFLKNIVWHTTSEDEKQEVLSVFSNSKIEVIPNGIYLDEYNKFNELSKQQYIEKYTNKKNFNNIDKIVVSLGRLQRKKGFDILIKAFAKSTYIKNSILLMAGPDEGEKDNLHTLINSLNLQEKVFLIGSINGQDKVDFLVNADLFVLPSHHENFGNVYVEALASGIPIVASKNTPWKAVEEYDCGLWINNSIEETTKAMDFMLNKNSNKMKINSKKLASKFDWNNLAIDFYHVLEDIKK